MAFLHKQLKLLMIGAILIAPSLAAGDQFELYLKAEKQITKGHIKSYGLTLEKLANHPLLPYLDAKALKRRFHTLPTEEIDQFFNTHASAPFSADVRRKWLVYLAKRKKWSLYLKYFEPTTSLVRQCYYVRALGAEGFHDKAYKEGKRLWLMGRSLPSACDTIFANWKKRSMLTDELVWQRLVNALDNRKYQLVRYLKAKLPKPQRQQAIVLRQLWKKPDTIYSSADFASLPANGRFILLKRALKRSPIGYTKPVFHAVTHDLTDAQLNELQSIAYFSAAKHQVSDQFEWFLKAKEKGILDEALNTAFLEGAVRNENWPIYNHLFKVSPNAIKQEARWQYWQGRALDSLGSSPIDSIPHYQNAALERSYYGFMAAQAIGVTPSMNHNPTYVDASKIQRTRLMPAVKRSLLLWELGRVTDARREWQFAFKQLDNDGRKALALLADRYDWADRAIMTLAQIKDWHDIQLRFPLAHADEISKAAERTKLAQNWIYGIARQESAFQYDARSPAGAMGLMQLMPQTAKSVSNRYKIRYSKNKLLKPTYNVDLGSRYMRMLLKRYEGNRVLATAAYNAGPGNVNRWLKRSTAPVDLWIENIPFKETRQYVQRVLAYSTIYSYRLGDIQPILDNQTLAAWESIHQPEIQVSGITELADASRDL